jgi:hypothetical protein
MALLTYGCSGPLGPTSRVARTCCINVGFAEADAWPITDDVFKPVAKFLSKKLFEPDMKHINPLIRYNFTPVGFWLNTYKLDYIVGVARKA